MKFFPISVKFTNACAGISRLVSPSSLGLGPLRRVVDWRWHISIIQRLYRCFHYVQEHQANDSYFLCLPHPERLIGKKVIVISKICLQFRFNPLYPRTARVLKLSSNAYWYSHNSIPYSVIKVVNITSYMFAKIIAKANLICIYLLRVKIGVTKYYTIIHSEQFVKLGALKAVANRSFKCASSINLHTSPVLGFVVFPNRVKWSYLRPTVKSISFVMFHSSCKYRDCICLVACLLVKGARCEKSLGGEIGEKLFVGSKVYSSVFTSLWCIHSYWKPNVNSFPSNTL